MYVIFLAHHGWVRYVGKTGRCSVTPRIYEAKQYQSKVDEEIKFAQSTNPGQITIYDLKDYSQ